MARTQTFLNGELGLNIRSKLNSVIDWNETYTYNQYDMAGFAGKIYASAIDNNVGTVPFNDIEGPSVSWVDVATSSSYSSNATLAESASYAISASWAPGGDSFDGTASYFSNASASIDLNGVFSNGGMTIDQYGQGNFNTLSARSINLSQGAVITGDLAAATITGSLLGTASVAISASWAPGGGSFDGTASYFDNGNGSTINGVGFANLGTIIVNDASTPTVAFLSSNGYNPGDTHGKLGFNGRNWSGDPSFSETSRIEGRKDAPDGNAGAALVFFTNDAGNNLQERARIDSVGNVGIGNTNPQYNLDVTGDIGNTNGGGDGIHNNPSFRITSKASSTYFNMNGGNVGISTNNPQSTLDVNGDINFTGTLNSNGTPGITTTQTFKDDLGVTKTMTITNGIIVSIT